MDDGIVQKTALEAVYAAVFGLEDLQMQVTDPFQDLKSDFCLSAQISLINSKLPILEIPNL
jgi:hypothetical protein